MNEIIDNSTIINDSNKSINECVFINTNNPKVKDQVQKKNAPCPLLRPPFPPLIDPKDLLIIGKDNKPTRSPNAFIIYRKVFFKTVKSEGHVLPMTSISSMASQSWEQESDEIKNYYKKLAREAYNYRNEIFPKKVSKRKKREKWNIISFKSNIPTTINNNGDSNVVSEIINDELLNIENLQLSTPTEDVLKNPLIDTFMQLNKINNYLLEHLILSNELSLNFLNNDENFQNNIQTNIPINDIEQFNNYFNDNIELWQEQIYPSPNLSLSDESNFASPNLDDLINSFPENLQQIENNNNEMIEQEKEIQQSIVDDLSQQFSFSQDIINNDSTNPNSFDNLNAFFDDTQPNFFDCLDNNLNNENVTVNEKNIEMNSELLTTDFTQHEGPDDLGITFPNAGFEYFFSL